MYNLIIDIKKGWNLISFCICNLNLNLLKENNNILEIRSLNESYNINVPKSFNTLNKLDSYEGYFLKSKKDFKLEISGDRIDYAIIDKIYLQKIKNQIDKKIKNINTNYKDSRLIEIKEGWNLNVE